MTSSARLTKDEFRLLTWSRREFSQMTINHESLQKHCPLDNDRHIQQSTNYEANDAVSHSWSTLVSLGLVSNDITRPLVRLRSL